MTEKAGKPAGYQPQQSEPAPKMIQWRKEIGLPPCFSCEDAPQVYVDGLCEKCHKTAMAQPGKDTAEPTQGSTLGELIRQKLGPLPPFKCGDWICLSEFGKVMQIEFDLAPSNQRVWQASTPIRSKDCGSGYLYRGHDSGYYRLATKEEALDEKLRLTKQTRQIVKRINALTKFIVT